MITKIIKYKDVKRDFEYTFKPIEETLKIEKTKKGYEVKYLIPDEDCISPNYYEDNNIFLVNYHKDYWISRDNIITKEDVINWYNGKKIIQEKNYYIFKLSCLIHSGISLSLNYSFIEDPQGWDTSHMGVVLISKKEAKNKKEAFKLAENLIKLWNQYFSGDVYSIVKERYNKEKKHIDYDIIRGYYGYEYALKCLEKEI